MEDRDYISLKEHLIAILDERTRNTEVRLNEMDKALKISKVEMERRLGELNHLRAEVMSDRVQYVRKEVCEKTETDTKDWREMVNSRLTTLETKIVTWVLALGAFISIAGAILKIFKVL